MKGLFTICMWTLTVGLLLCLACVNSQTNVDIYVSNSRGNSLNDGLSKSTPLDSLQDAANLIKKMKETVITNQTQFIVNIEGGRYFIESPINIPAPNKFNDRNSPTIWRPMSLNDKVVLTGGVALPLKLWQVVTSSNNPNGFNMLHPKAKGNVYMIDLNKVPNLNVTAQITPFQRSGWQFGRAVDSSNELFFQRRVQTVARYPNIDASASDVFIQMEQVPYDGANVFSFNSSLCENRAKWPLETDPFIAGYLFWDWADAVEDIVNIQSNGTVLLKPKVASYGVREGQRFYLTNFLSELDTPGEYTIVNNTLFYWPLVPFLKNSTGVSDEDLVLSATSIIFQINAEAQTFEGLELEMTTGTAIKSNDIDYIIVNRTTISNTGSNAIWISACHTGCQILNNIIYENGQGGISINGGIRRNLTPSGIIVSNNTVFNFSRIGKTYRAGIQLQGVGGLVTHNYLYNADHVAILWSGNDHVISLNKIHDVCKTAGDMGAIYSGRDWTMRGNLIKHNLIYRIKGPGAGGTSCIYLDDMFSSVDIIENICYDSYRGVLIGGGRDNVVWKNLFIDVTYTFQVDDRGFTRDLTEITKNLFAVPFNNSLWSSRYPRLANILEDEPRAPKGNDIRFNLISGKALTSIDSSVYQYSTYMNNTFNVPKTIFANITALNLTVVSSTYGVNFTLIPFDEIGLLPATNIVTNDTNPPIPPIPQPSVKPPTPQPSITPQPSPKPSPQPSISPHPSPKPHNSPVPQHSYITPQPTIIRGNSPTPYKSNDTRVVSGGTSNIISLAITFLIICLSVLQ